MNGNMNPKHLYISVIVLQCYLYLCDKTLQLPMQFVHLICNGMSSGLRRLSSCLGKWWEVGERSWEYGKCGPVSQVDELLQCHPGNMWQHIVSTHNWTSASNISRLHIADLNALFIKSLSSKIRQWRSC